MESSKLFRTTLVGLILTLLLPYQGADGAEKTASEKISYSKEECATLKYRIQERTRLARHFRAEAANKNIVFMRMRCQTGEGHLRCQTRCKNKFKRDCFWHPAVKNAVFVSYDKKKVETYWDNRNQPGKFNTILERHDRLCKDLTDPDGYMAMEEQERDKEQKLYDEHCSKSKGNAIFETKFD